MATQIGISFSQDQNPAQAFRTAAVAIKSQTNLTVHDLIMISSTSDYPPQQEDLDTIKTILQPRHMIYTFSPALILSNAIEPRGVAIMALTSDDICLSLGRLDHLNLLPEQESGLDFSRSIAYRLQDPRRHAFIYFLTNTLNHHNNFIRGLQEGLGRAFPIIAGIIDTNTTKTSSLGYQNHLFSDAAVGMLIGGQTVVEVGTQHGWQPLGKPRTITSSKGNVIHKINGEPAISIYENYFKDLAQTNDPNMLANIGLLYPLGMGTETPKKYLLRRPISVLADGSLVCQGDVSNDASLHLMIGDKDACRQAAHLAALNVRESLHGRSPRLLLIFISCARKKLFGRSAWKEIAIIKETLGLTTPIFGVYTYGEIAPQEIINNIRNTQSQNASIVITAIG